MHNITPVLLIVFNRPESTSIVFESIRKNEPKQLFIACDGPRLNNVDDEKKINQVKNIVGSIDWDCKVQKLFQEKNLGCSKGPRAAIAWFFENVESGIILEDDCLPSEDFFHFCNVLLEYYKEDYRILNICGSNMGDNRENESGYFFSRFMNMSGWATWRRSVQSVDYNLTSWANSSRSLFSVYKILRQHFFDTDINWFIYWKSKFDKTIFDQNITWWDWQWIYNQLSSKKLSIIPNKNLVTNIGFNKDATHTKDSNNPLANIPTESLQFPLNHPKLLKADIEYEEYAVKWIWCYHKRLKKRFYIKQFLTKLFKKLK